jgi:hypothetical protein
MALIPIQIPPGVYRNGTELQAAGRWYDANLVRWFEGTLRPMGGWRKRSTTAVSGVARGLLPWSDNSADRWVGIGTHSHLYVMRADGVVKDITPEGYTSGIINASANTGFGGLAYGAYSYGTARPDLGVSQPATTWALDNWGEYLVACADRDGKIYEWQLDFATPTVAEAIENAPVNCRSVSVTAERFIFALGAGGNPRKVQWCDQEDNTIWTPATNNQAGDYELVTPGALMAGKRVRGLHLLWTDTDVHSAQYIGQPFIYGFEKIGSGCGLISKQAVSVMESSAIWMGPNGFWMYDGTVRPLPSDVGDYVYRNMNQSQASKVYSVHFSAFNEVWWFYPSQASLEVDSYVTYNYRENHWNIGLMSRTCGSASGVFKSPLLVGLDGYVYDHDVGLTNGETVFAESGPVQIGVGDNVMAVREVVPDELTQGDVSVSFSTKFYPNDTEYAHGPYSTANPTPVRFTGRQVKMKIEQERGANWRVGTMRLDAVAGGRR